MSLTNTAEVAAGAVGVKGKDVNASDKAGKDDEEDDGADLAGTHDGGGDTGDESVWSEAACDGG